MELSLSQFAQDIEAWNNFFVLSGTAAATLMGLLFVAITLRTDIRAQGHDAPQKTTASHSFVSYLCVLLFSLYFLIPNQSATSLALEIGLTCAYPIYDISSSFLRFRSSPALSRADQFWRYLIPLFCYVLGVAIAISFFFNDDSEISWFVTVVALLLAVPTRNAWMLVLESQEPA
jgi:uncharacterized membrane protein